MYVLTRDYVKIT